MLTIINANDLNDKKCPNCSAFWAKDGKSQFRLTEFDYNSEEGCYVDTCECIKCSYEFKINLFYLNILSTSEDKHECNMGSEECAEILGSIITFIRDCYIEQDKEGGVTPDFMLGTFFKTVDKWRTSVKALQYATNAVKKIDVDTVRVSAIKDTIANFETEMHNLLEEKDENQ